MLLAGLAAAAALAGCGGSTVESYPDTLITDVGRGSMALAAALAIADDRGFSGPDWGSAEPAFLRLQRGELDTLDAADFYAIKEANRASQRHMLRLADRLQRNARKLRDATVTTAPDASADERGFVSLWNRNLVATARRFDQLAVTLRSTRDLFVKTDQFVDAGHDAVLTGDTSELIALHSTLSDVARATLKTLGRASSLASRPPKTSFALTDYLNENEYANGLGEAVNERFPTGQLAESG